MSVGVMEDYKLRDLREVVQQISANMSCSGIYLYIYCAHYCSVFVPMHLPSWSKN
jgi:hypothetical protein